MAERTVELDSAITEELQVAEERARRANEELQKLREEHAQETAQYGNAEKQPPSPSSAANADPSVPSVERGSADQGGEDELRKDSMMARLLDALDAGKDVGHYGRLVFAMVARHFLPHEQVLTCLQKDRDFSEAQARAMLLQVDTRDYNPPKRARLLEWQSEQEFQFIHADDPDDGNLYRNLKFPQQIYDHIGGYQEAKAETA